MGKFLSLINTIAILFSPIILPTTTFAQGYCPGALGPSFEIGDRFVVPYGGGSTYIFEHPNETPKLGEMREGTGGTILGGPECVRGQEGNLYTWYVKTDSGEKGWAAEGYSHSAVPWIEPVENTPVESSNNTFDDNEAVAQPPAQFPGTSGESYTTSNPPSTQNEDSGEFSLIAIVITIACTFGISTIATHTLNKYLDDHQNSKISLLAVLSIVLVATVWVSTNNFWDAVIALVGSTAGVATVRSRRSST